MIWVIISWLQETTGVGAAQHMIWWHISWYDIHYNDIFITGDNRGGSSPAQQETRSLWAVSCSLKGPQGSPSKFIISIITLNQCNTVATDDCEKNKKFPVWFPNCNVACRNTKHFITIILIIIFILMIIIIIIILRLRSTAKTSVLGPWSRRRWWRMTSSRTFHRARWWSWWWRWWRWWERWWWISSSFRFSITRLSYFEECLKMNGIGVWCRYAWGILM